MTRRVPSTEEERREHLRAHGLSPGASVTLDPTRDWRRDDVIVAVTPAFMVRLSDGKLVDPVARRIRPREES